MTSKALIIPAAGAGKRMNRRLPKPFIRLDGKTILEHTLSCFLGLEGLQQIVVSTSEALRSDTEGILQKSVGDSMQWQCVIGGDERQHSIHNALKVIAEVDLVMVHDAVRPFCEKQYIEACCKKAEQTGAAIVGIPAKDTIKKVDQNGNVLETPDRRDLWQIQTPQVFEATLIKKAYEEAASEGFLGTDDASLIEWLGEPVAVVKGDISNIKITYPMDLEMAKMLIQKKRNNR